MLNTWLSQAGAEQHVYRPVSAGNSRDCKVFQCELVDASLNLLHGSSPTPQWQPTRTRHSRSHRSSRHGCARPSARWLAGTSWRGPPRRREQPPRLSNSQTSLAHRERVSGPQINLSRCGLGVMYIPESSSEGMVPAKGPGRPAAAHGRTPAPPHGAVTPRRRQAWTNGHVVARGVQSHRLPP